jgi:hypothetical protein
MRTSMAWPRATISLLLQAQRLAAGDADHLGHQVDAGDHLGHRMLDLNAGVHLDEVEAVGVVVIEIFDRAGAANSRPRGSAHTALRTALAHPVGQRRGRLFPDLLAAALQRAFAFEAMHRVRAVAQHLHLDVPGLGDHLFHIKPAVAKGGQRLGAACGKAALELGQVIRDADAAPAAARPPP